MRLREAKRRQHGGQEVPQERTRGPKKSTIVIGFKKEGGELIINPENKSEKTEWRSRDRLVVIGKNSVHATKSGGKF